MRSHRGRVEAAACSSGCMQDLQDKSLRTSRTLIGSVLLSFILMVAAAVLTLRISKQADEADAWVVHTLEVKQKIAQLTGALASAESGQRGYLITGDKSFLEPYRLASESVPSLLEKLRELVVDNTTQQEMLDAVTPLILEKITIIGRILELVGQGEHARATQIVRTSGTHMMKDIREQMAGLDAGESTLLATRRSTVAMLRRQFAIAVAAMLLASVCLTGLSMFGVRRHIALVEASRQRLATINSELEERVAQRTLDLAQAAEVATRERNRAEALLTDVNHRVGNNLALVSSFLTMQQRNTKNPEAARALNAARARVQAVASAHRKLRLGEDFASVKANEVLGAVLEDICAGLPPGEFIKVNCRIAPLQISARDAVSLGVLTSELVMNAVKHAFTPGERGEINVVFADGGASAPYLEVTDDGVGWHEKYTQESTGLGAKIISMVARQFGGAPQRGPLRQDGVRPGTAIRIDLARIQVIHPS